MAKDKEREETNTLMRILTRAVENLRTSFTTSPTKAATPKQPIPSPPGFMQFVVGQTVEGGASTAPPGTFKPATATGGGGRKPPPRRGRRVAGGFGGGQGGGGGLGGFEWVKNVSDMMPSGKAGKFIDLLTTGSRAAEGDPIAILKILQDVATTIKDKVEQIEEHLAGAGGEFLKSATSKRAEDIGGHFFKGIEEYGKAWEQLNPIVGKAVELMGQFGEFLADSLGKLRKWNDELYQGNIRFAEFSGAMSMVKAETDIQQMLLSRQRGETQAGAAGFQARSRIALEQRLQPFESNIARIQSSITGMVNNIAVGVLNLPWFKAIEWMVKKIADSLPQDEGKEMDTATWMEKMGATPDAITMYGRPQRFTPPPSVSTKVSVHASNPFGGGNLF